jgi:hypothetical protein
MSNELKVAAIISRCHGETEEETKTYQIYYDRCQQYLFDRGFAPVGGQGSYPRVLNDSNLDDRKKGILANQAVIERADIAYIFLDYGVSDGMWDDFLHLVAAWRGEESIFRVEIGKNPEVKPEMKYSFPATKWAKTESPQEQIEVIWEEFDEFDDIGDLGSEKDLEEAFDVMQAFETYFRILERDGIDITAARERHIKKLTDRGYYAE